MAVAAAPDAQQPLVTVNCSAWSSPPARPKAPHTTTLSRMREERAQNREAQVEAAGRDLDAALEATRAAADAKGKAVGAWGVLRGAVRKGFASAVSVTNKGVDATAQRLAQLRFQHRFPEIAAEPIDAVFAAKILHNGMPVSGTVYVTPGHVCWHNGGTLRIAVAMEELVSVVLCISLQTYDVRPFLVPRPSDDVVCDAMQLYLRNKTLVDLVHIEPDTGDAAVEVTNGAFKHNRAADMCHASVYDAWSHVVPALPLPGVEYSEA